MAAPVEIAGFGLFTSRPAVLIIAPGVAGEGIVFRRAGTEVPIPAHIASLSPQASNVPARITNLGFPPGGIMTVEHLLSALAGLNITDAAITLDGPEIPIGDGSASMFVEGLARAGTSELDAEAGVPPLTIDREIVVEAGNARILARPRSVPGCRYTYELDFGPGPIGAQTATFEADWSPASAAQYVGEIAPARTFCLEAEAAAMRGMGLFTNLTPRDMLVFGELGPIDNELRFENEPARHKVLDLIGDLSLVGRRIQADITATRAGHALNHAMARALLEAATN